MLNVGRTTEQSPESALDEERRTSADRDQMRKQKDSLSHEAFWRGFAWMSAWGIFVQSAMVKLCHSFDRLN
jgi:hypothetical protein